MLREPQVLNADEMIVYEGIATLRRPMGTEDLMSTTGLDEETVRSAIHRLSDLGMIADDSGRAVIGPNDWDVRGAQ
jgi:predicted transcriptional regulator